MENAESIFDIHDIEGLKKLWFLIRDSQNIQEIFALVQVLLESLPYDWIDTKENWIVIANQLDAHGEAELASLFKLANQRCFRLSTQA